MCDYIIFIKTEEGHEMKTTIDTRKENADFLLEQINNDAIIKIQNDKIYNIKFYVKEVYDNGCLRITKKALEKLQNAFTWEPNF